MGIFIDEASVVIRGFRLFIRSTTVGRKELSGQFLLGGVSNQMSVLSIEAKG